LLTVSIKFVISIQNATCINCEMIACGDFILLPSW